MGFTYWGGGAFADVAVNAVNFPDEIFREYVSGIDRDGDGILSTTELASVTVIDIHKEYNTDSDSKISSLKGIEYFTNLEYLDCSYNLLTTLDLSKNTALEWLNCSRNILSYINNNHYLRSLNVTGCTKLQTLRCYGNALTALDLSTNTALTELSCSENNLTALDVSKNTALTELDCWDNYLTTLDVSKNAELIYLSCTNNRLTDLDVSGHIYLEKFICEEDENFHFLKNLNLSGCTSLTVLSLANSVSLTHLNVSGCTSLPELYLEGFLCLTELNASGCTSLNSLYVGNGLAQGSLSSLNLTGCTALTELYCSGNKLTSLNLSTLTNLTHLYCNNNALTALDVSKNLALEYLYCGYNRLTALDVSNNSALTEIECPSNYLTSLNLTGCTALESLFCDYNDLTALDVSKNLALTYLSCSSNKLTALDVSNNTKLETLWLDDNNLSEVGLSSNTALTHIGTAYNRFESLDISRYTTLESIYCDFPITAGSNNTWEFDFTAFKEAYGIDGDFDTSSSVYYNYFNPLDYTVDQSSGKYILRFERLAEDTLDFTCNLNNSQQLLVSVRPSVDFSSMTAPLITTSSLPAVSVDSGGYYYYEYGLSAYGTRDITYKVIDGFLPVGLYFDEAGEFWGHPRIAGSSTFTVRAKNKVGSSTRTFTIAVPYLTPKEPPVITTTSLTDGTAGLPYGFQLTAEGTDPIKWQADSLPKGLSLTPTGYITGTLSESGDFTLSVTASNDYDTDSRTLSLKVAEAPSGTKPSITTDALDDATAGSTYAYQLGVSGTPPITWTVKGKLPDGLSINSSGLITGTPTKKGSKKITVTAKNSAGEDTKKLTLAVYELPEIVTETLKEAKAGKKYSMGIKTKGTKPLTWEIDGELPDGITFDTTKGKFSGTPTENTTASVKITLSNSVGSVSQAYTLKVAGTPPKIGLSKLKNGKYGKNYKAALKVKGSDPITLTLIGELPEGLSFDSEAGTITGTPTEACTERAIRIIASNAADVVSKDFTLTIQAVAPKFQTKKLPDAVKGKPYSTDIEVTGTPEITFTATGLSSGLTISNDGTISGTPTEFGKFKAAITATNAAKAVKKNVQLIVLAAPEISGSGTLASGTQGKSYKHTFTATGSKTITFSIAKGALPGGLTLSAKGKLSGKPTASGTFEFTVKAANSAGETSKDFTVTIAASTTNKSAYTAPDTEHVSGIQNRSSRGNTAPVVNLVPENAVSDFDGEYVVVAELPEVSVDVSGMYDFSVELDENAHAGEKLVWLANSSEPSEDDKIAEFFDEAGQEINAVPENRRLSISVWLNAGRIYKPAIAVKR